MRGYGTEGDEVLLFLRPELVRVREGPLVAEVEGAEYPGDRWEVWARFRSLALLLLAGCDLRPESPVVFDLPRAQPMKVR